MPKKYVRIDVPPTLHGGERQVPRQWRRKQEPTLSPVSRVEAKPLSQDRFFVILDGLATAEFMSNKGIPVILISGHPDAEQLVVEHQPGAACVRKPASLQALRQAIDVAPNGN